MKAVTLFFLIFVILNESESDQYDYDYPIYSSYVLPRIPSCGILPAGSNASERIYNGVNADEGEVPWAVQFKVKNSVGEAQRSPDGSVTVNYEITNCGGSIINDQYVLTAAHCCNRAGNKSKVWINAGGNEFGGLFSEKYSTIVDEVIIHPDFELENYEGNDLLKMIKNDICLLRLESELDFTGTIYPICLPLSKQEMENDVQAGDLVYVAGWGRISEEDERDAEYLQIAEVKAMPQDECDSNNRPNVVCAGGEVGGEIRNVLVGDSGGPLYKKIHTDEGSAYYLYGITSTKQKTEMPSTFERVTAHIQWILSVIEP